MPVFSTPLNKTIQ